MLSAAFSERVLGMRRPYDWYGRRGKAVRRVACKAALDFVDDLSDLPLPRVSPASNGAVALYWQAGPIHLTVYMWGNQVALREKITSQPASEALITTQQAAARVRELLVSEVA
jgi:hypothetical protein